MLTTEDNNDIILDNDDKNNMKQEKRVRFAEVVEERTFIINENDDVIFYDGITTEKIQNSKKDEEDARELSFEESANKFLIEDSYYRIPYNLPRKVEEISWLKEVPIEESQHIILKINEAINIAKENKKYSFYRIDGLLLKKPGKELLIFTEFFIFDFSYTKNNNYITNRIIEIQTIDYITITRNGNIMILHLVPVYKNKENINKNYILQYKQLESVVGCITSTYFYDKPEYTTLENINRRIAVITVNENFSVFEGLETIFDFEEYRNVLSDFLEEKLLESNLPNCLPDDLSFKFKYASVKYRNKEKNNNFSCGDFIITRNDLFILNYNVHKRKFDLVYRISMNNLVKLSINKNAGCCFIIYDNKIVPNGIEVKTESYSSIVQLIDYLYQEYISKNKKDPKNISNK